MIRKLVIFIVVTVILVIVYNLINQIITISKAGDRLTEALADLHQLEVKNKQLKEELKLVKTPEFIEKEARNKLGLTKEGETLVIIPEETFKKIIGSDKVEIKLPNPLGWWKLFF